ncbi:MAG: type V CRISPR-associated protein Cas12d/CasY [Microgenomates group bacterium]
MKKKKIAGYRLHKERILFSGGAIIRTIKYPLVPLTPTQETKEFLKKFEEAVISDDLKIRGDLNLNDYLVYTALGKTPYTLFDFWKDCLKAGVIWMPTSSELIVFIRNKYHLPSPIDIIWEKASPRITKIFKKEKFKEILERDPVRSLSTKKSFYKRIINYLKEDFLLKKENFYEIISSDAKKEVDFIVNSFFNDKGKLVLDGKKQYEFWKKEYNLDKSILESCKPKGKYADLTFFIIPELIENLNFNVNLEDLVNKREKWLEDKNLLISILGLSNNFNGFSNFFGVVLKSLQKNDIEEIYKAQKMIFPLLESEKEKVLESLNFLSEKAKLLSQPSLPLINGWHEYRSVFGGKLQSWFTNYQKRKIKLDEQLNDFKKNLIKAKEYLKNQHFTGDAVKEKEDILELLSVLEKFFTDENKNIKAEENYQVFESLLSLVKRRLNFFYQAYIKKEEDETKVNKFEAFKGLYEKIYKPVAFYGEATRRKNEKFVNQTIPILKDGIENVKKLLSYLKESFSILETFEVIKREKETPEDFYRKFLQFFWNKYSEGAINSSLFRKKYEELLQENVTNEEWEKIKDKSQRSNYIFYQSPYAKGTLKKIEIKTNNYLEKLEKEIFLLIEFLSSFKNDELLKEREVLLDWVELSKNVISLLLRFNKKQIYELNELILNNFSQAKRYVELFNSKKYSKNEFGFIIQSLIFSEIRGAATLYSKRKYSAQYSVQVVGADKKFRLYYIPNDAEIYLSKEINSKPNNSEERKQLMKKHYYVLSLGRAAEKKKTESFNSLALTKNGINPVFLVDEVKNYLFRVSSSPYQLQFLDKYLYRPKGWENIEVNLSEWNFIVERRYQIEWDLNAQRPVFLPVTDEKERRKNKLYVAIPFNLKPITKLQKLAPLKMIAKGKEREERDLSRLNYPILGVDVGEYGLAYCLVNFNYDKETYKILGIEILKDKNGKPIVGFIEDKNIANIKDKFVEIQQKTREGIFEEEDSIVARIRENAIGALRNRVHLIVTQKGSSIVYEDSITNFETGSGRTTKIYNSVKRADTKFEIEADKQIHKHIWGEGAKWVGRNVSAYASSYTCIKCLRSVYQIKEKDLEEIEIIKKEGKIITMKTPYGEMKGYVSSIKDYQEGFKFKKNNDSLKILRKIVQDFSRPPVSKRSEVLEKYTGDILKENKIDIFRKKRGNSAIFVCPFCQFIADADIQASFMMALRGYLRFSGLVSSGENAGRSFLEKTINSLQGIDRKEIIEVLSLKF